MVNGEWSLSLAGEGKIHPADADEIQQLLTEFIGTLVAAGHVIEAGNVSKHIK